MDPPPTAPPTAQPYSPEQAMYPPAYPPGQYPVVTQQPAPYAQQTSNTTVVLGQQQVVVQKAQRNWSSGLCGCFDDCGSLCKGLCCPFLLLTEVSSRMGEGCCFPCCCPGALLGLRIKLRVQENIQGTLFDDYCAVECCPLCVLCQLARELNHVQRRG